jgi:type I restriction enzyme S subunit
MAQCIFKEWFVEFNFPNEEGVPYKDNGGEMVESELGEIPEGWRIEELREILKFIKGKKANNISEVKESDTQQQYLTIKAYTGDEVLFADIDKVILVEENEIVMVMDGSSSGTILYGKNGIVASTIAKIKTIKKIIDETLLFYILKHNENEIKQHLTGSAIPHTDKEFIYRIKVALPKYKIDLSVFENIRKKIIENQKSNKTLIKTRNILLLKLMSGEVRI